MKRPSYFLMLPGSVNNVASLKMTMQETKVLNILLVVNSGFYSARNIRNLDDQGTSYKMPLK
jgi:transposase